MLEVATRVYVSDDLSLMVYKAGLEIISVEGKTPGAVAVNDIELSDLLRALEATAVTLSIETKAARLVKALEKLLAEAETGDQTWDTVRQARAALAEAK